MVSAFRAVRRWTTLFRPMSVVQRTLLPQLRWAVKIRTGRHRKNSSQMCSQFFFSCADVTSSRTMSHERATSEMSTMSFGIKNASDVLRVRFNVNIGIPLGQYLGVKLFFFPHHPGFYNLSTTPLN